MEDRWKRRTAPKHSVVFVRPRTLVLEEAAPAGEAALYRAEEVTPAPTPAVDEVRARFDQLRVDKRIRDSLIDWPPNPACIAASQSLSGSCGPSSRTARSRPAFIRTVTASGWRSRKSRPVGCWDLRHEATSA